MSRSYKKVPISKIGCKGYRQILNKKFRRKYNKTTDDIVHASNEAYLVCDYRWYPHITKWFTEEDMEKAKRK